MPQLTALLWLLQLLWLPQLLPPPQLLWLCSSFALALLEQLGSSLALAFKRSRTALVSRSGNCHQRLSEIEEDCPVTQDQVHSLLGLDQNDLVHRPATSSNPTHTTLVENGSDAFGTAKRSVCEVVINTSLFNRTLDDLDPSKASDNSGLDPQSAPGTSRGAFPHPGHHPFPVRREVVVLSLLLLSATPAACGFPLATD